MEETLEAVDLFPVLISAGKLVARGERFFVLAGDRVKSMTATEAVRDVADSVYLVGGGKQWFAILCYASHDEAREKLNARLREERRKLEERLEQIRTRMIELDREQR